MRQLRLSTVIAITISAIIGASVFVALQARAAQTAVQPQNGGTGSNSIPTYGQVLVGNGNGSYTPLATSSLGIGATANAGGNPGQIQWNSNGVLAGIATGTVNCTGSASCGAGSYVLGNPLTITVSGGTGFSTTSAAYWLTTNTTDNLSEGATNLYFTNTRAINALTGQNISIFTNNAGYLTPTTFATSFDNRLSATTSLPNITTLSGLSLPYSQLTGTPNLSQYLTLAAWFATTTDQLREGGTNLYFTNGRADARFVTDLAATSSVKSITTLPSLSLPFGQLTGVPAFDTFAYPFPAGATTSALTLGGLTLSNITGSTQCLHANASGLITGTGTDCGSGGGSVTGVTGSYPVLSSGGTAPNISLAFGTTTSNTWAGSQTFTNPLIDGTLSGLIAGNSGQTYAVSTSSLNANITGNAGTATALAANGSNCAGGFFPLGIDASGNVESCTYAFATTTPWSNSGLIAINTTGKGYAIASSSLFGYTPLNPTRAINTTYPLQGGGNLTGDLTLSTALTTTTNQTWSGTQTFNNVTINGTCTGCSSGSGITNLGPSGQSQAGPNITLASSTAGSDFSITGSGNTITFNLPSASASNRGLLSSSDWNTFNGKLGSVTADAPLTGSGTSGSHLSIPQANGSTNGYLSSADWTAFNNKAGFGYPFPSNATSTTLTFGNGIVVNGASSTFAGSPGNSTTTYTGSVQVGSTAGNHQVYIVPTGTYSTSDSVGGSVNMNFSNTNAGLDLFSNSASGSGILDVDYSGTTGTTQPVRVESSATNVSAVNVQCAALGLGCFKGSALSDQGANGSIFSADASTNSNTGMTYFGKCASGNGTCENTTDATSHSLLTLLGGGYLGISNSTPTHALDIGSNFSVSSSTGNTTIGGTLTLTPLATPAGSFLAVDPNGTIIATTTSGGVASVGATYPVQSTGGTNPTISLAFGTTTSNTWAGTQTFTNPLVDGTLSGLIGGNSGATYAISTTSMNASITGSAGSVANALTFNNGGSGAASGSTFDGSAAKTVSYNTIGAVPTSRNINATFPLQGGGPLSGDLMLTTAFSTTSNTGMSQGNLYVGSSGILQTAASSSIFGYTPLNPARQLTINGTTNQITSSAGAQDLSADRTWTLSFPNLVIFPSNASSTLFSTSYASSTQYFGAGLASCSGASNALTYDGAGRFGCNTISAGSSASSTLLSDSNTFSGANTFTGNTNFPSGIWNSGGNVGIGTTTPQNPLSIVTSGTALQTLLNLTSSVGQASEEPALDFGNSGATNNIPFGRLSVTPGTSFTNSKLTLWTADSSKTLQRRLTIDNAGNVGIGTTSPSTALSVQGNALVSGNLSVAGITATGTATLANSSTTLASVSSELNIPNAATSPTLSTGDIKIDTNTASSSMRYGDGTATRALYADFTASVVAASSSLTALGSYGTSGTTTINVQAVYRPTTIEKVLCKTDTGSAYVNFNDGTNHTNTVVCSASPSWTTLNTNNTFTMGGSIEVDVGTQSSNPNIFTITAQVLPTAD